MTDAVEARLGLRANWPLVLAGFVISFVVIGGGINTVGVFLNALAASTDWSRSILSVAVSTGAGMAALSTPLIGVLIDRHGVRVPIVLGLFFLAAGFAILMFMQEAWHFVAANVFLGPGFAACSMLPLTVAVTVLVPDRTSLAIGIVSTGASAGSLVLLPAAQAVVEAIGWRSTYMVTGPLILLTPIPFLLFALPRGRLHSGVGGASAPDSPVVLSRDLNRPGVASLTTVMVLPSLVGFSISVHLVPYLTNIGHSGPVAALALGGAIGISAVGKIAGGFAGDRFGVLRTLRVAVATSVFALCLLSLAVRPAALAGFVVFWGLAAGTLIAVVPAIARNILGSERFGTLFGMLQLASMLASAVGPVATGVLFDCTGGYGAALVLWITAVALAAVVALFIPGAAARGGPEVEEVPG